MLSKHNQEHRHQLQMVTVDDDVFRMEKEGRQIEKVQRLMHKAKFRDLIMFWIIHLIQLPFPKELGSKTCNRFDFWRRKKISHFYGICRDWKNASSHSNWH